jgi:hypothetical protein
MAGNAGHQPGLGNRPTPINGVRKGSLTGRIRSPVSVSAFVYRDSLSLCRRAHERGP